MSEVMLPATRVLVPAGGDYSIARYKSIRGREGVAYECQLARAFGAGHRVVAEILDDGSGGEVDVQFLDGEEFESDGHKGRRMVTLTRWASARTSPERDRFLAWCAQFTGRWSVKHDLDWCPEGVISTLVEEVELARELTRRRAVSFLLPGDQPTEGYRVLTTRDQTRAAAYLAQEHPDVEVLIWAGAEWVPISSLLTAKEA